MLLIYSAPDFISRLARYQRAKYKLKDLKFYPLAPPPPEVVM